VGSRSKARARAQANVAPPRQLQGPAAQQPHRPAARPLTITVAAAVQAIQSVGILLAAILAGIATIEGKSYETASGIAITAIGVGTAIVLGLVAFGLARTRRWSRTPAMMTQFFVGIVGIYLVQSHRWSWGIPALVLCVAGFVLLLLPPSIRALTEAKDADAKDTQAPSSPSALAK
jgi:hypothetical protein